MKGVLEQFLLVGSDVSRDMEWGNELSRQV
jgi:hypothetical protein